MTFFYSDTVKRHEWHFRMRTSLYSTSLLISLGKALMALYKSGGNKISTPILKYCREFFTIAPVAQRQLKTRVDALKPEGGQANFAPICPASQFKSADLFLEHWRYHFFVSLNPLVPPNNCP